MGHHLSLASYFIGPELEKEPKGGNVEHEQERAPRGAYIIYATTFPG